MSDATDPRAWVERAEEDLIVARSVLRRSSPLTNSACFHAQQCAEKYLKAILVAQGRTFPRTHDLVELSGLLAQSNVIVPVDDDRLADLSAQAVRVRYPGSEPTPDEARASLGIAVAVRRFARRLLGVR
jgi:HEPN domain-containing protein